MIQLALNKDSMQYSKEARNNLKAVNDRMALLKSYSIEDTKLKSATNISFMRDYALLTLDDILGDTFNNDFDINKLSSISLMLMLHRLVVLTSPEGSDIRQEIDRQKQSEANGKRKNIKFDKSTEAELLKHGADFLKTSSIASSFQYSSPDVYNAFIETNNLRQSILDEASSGRIDNIIFDLIDLISWVEINKNTIKYYIEKITKAGETVQIASSLMPDSFIMSNSDSELPFTPSGIKRYVLKILTNALVGGVKYYLEYLVSDSLKVLLTETIPKEVCNIIIKSAIMNSSLENAIVSARFSKVLLSISPDADVRAISNTENNPMDAIQKKIDLISDEKSDYFKSLDGMFDFTVLVCYFQSLLRLLEFLKDKGINDSKKIKLYSDVELYLYNLDKSALKIEGFANILKDDPLFKVAAEIEKSKTNLDTIVDNYSNKYLLKYLKELLTIDKKTLLGEIKFKDIMAMMPIEERLDFVKKQISETTDEEDKQLLQQEYDRLAGNKPIVKTKAQTESLKQHSSKTKSVITLSKNGIVKAYKWINAHKKIRFVILTSGIFVGAELLIGRNPFKDIYFIGQSVIKEINKSEYLDLLKEMDSIYSNLINEEYLKGNITDINFDELIKDAKTYPAKLKSLSKDFDPIVYSKGEMDNNFNADSGFYKEFGLKLLKYKNNKQLLENNIEHSYFKGIFGYNFLTDYLIPKYCSEYLFGLTIKRYGNSQPIQLDFIKTKNDRFVIDGKKIIKERFAYILNGKEYADIPKWAKYSSNNSAYLVGQDEKGSNLKSASGLFRGTYENLIHTGKTWLDFNNSISSNFDVHFVGNLEKALYNVIDRDPNKSGILRELLFYAKDYRSDANFIDDKISVPVVSSYFPNNINVDNATDLYLNLIVHTLAMRNVIVDDKFKEQSSKSFLIPTEYINLVNNLREMSGNRDIIETCPVSISKDNWNYGVYSYFINPFNDLIKYYISSRILSENKFKCMFTDGDIISIAKYGNLIIGYKYLYYCFLSILPSLIYDKQTDSKFLARFSSMEGNQFYDEFEKFIIDEFTLFLFLMFFPIQYNAEIDRPIEIAKEEFKDILKKDPNADISAYTGLKINISSTINPYYHMNLNKKDSEGVIIGNDIAEGKTNIYDIAKKYIKIEKVGNNYAISKL